MPYFKKKNITSNLMVLVLHAMQAVRMVSLFTNNFAMSPIVPVLAMG